MKRGAGEHRPQVGAGCPATRTGQIGMVTRLLAFAAALVLAPAPSFASHLSQAPEGCSSCHTLNNNEGDPNTSGISYASRTLTTMRILNGGTPATFGCTFCHNTDSNIVKMKGALSHFQGKTSMHPVGRTLAGSDTFNEFLTSTDRLIANELDCVDCHDPLLVTDQSPANLAMDAPYANHVGPTDPSRVNNPFMLRDFADANPATYPDYSASTVDFCRICHGTVPIHVTPEGQDVTLTAHAETAIAESDTTPLRTSECADCHASHSSANNYKLFEAGIDVSNASTCASATGPCHLNGDANDNFTDHGHGMATSTAGNTLNFKCGACHSVNSRHDGSDDVTNPKMFNYTEDPTPSPLTGKSVESVCYICHGGYAGHLGSPGASCIECHDEHAEGVGAGSNSYMIPLLLPNNGASTEPVTFDITDPVAYDYYRADGTGVCDNGVCHAGVTVPDPLGGPDIDIAPLSNIMSNSAHTGDDKLPDTVDCKSCHDHGDAVGSWSASGSCDDCHGQPPVGLATTEAGYTDHTEANSPHALHAKAQVDGGYGFSCRECHGGWTGDSHDATPNSYDSIWFDQTTNPLTTAYNPSTPTVTPDYDKGTETCSNLYCHSSGATGNSVGSQQWMSGASTPDYSTVDLGCGACHAAAPTTGSHSAHVSAGAGCQNCHAGTTNDGTSVIRDGGLHVNRAKDVSAGGTFFGATVSFGGTTSCTDISCHGGAGASAAWGGSLGCADCHMSAAADVNDFSYGNGTVARVNSAEWTGAGHGRPTASGNYPGPFLNPAANFLGTGTDTEGCAYCHGFLGTAQNPVVAHNVGTNPFRLTNVNVLARGEEDGGMNDVCLVCHSSLPAATGYDPNGAVAGYTNRNGSDIDENHYNSAKHAASGGGKFCWDCHDPHGDAQHLMVHSGTGTPAGNGVTMVSDGTYGIPTTSRPVTGLNVVGGFDSYDLVNVAYSGLCQTCHTDASLPWRNSAGFTDPASHQGANSTICTGCHEHTADFAAGCSTCHGFPPPESPFTGTTQTWTSDKAATPSGVGEHTSHGGYVAGDCNTTCHIIDTHGQNKTAANMGVRAATVAASTGVHQYGTVDNQDVWTGNTAGVTSVVDDSCVNVSCHSSSYLANANQSAANPTYTRFWNQNYDCYSCHAYDGTTDSTIRPGAEIGDAADRMASGSHGEHVGTYALACTNCHTSNAGNNAHKDGAVSFTANYGATRAGAVATGGTYDLDGATGGWNPWSGTPAEGGHAYYCGNVYCHSAGVVRGGAGFTASVAQWKTPASADCGDCHGVNGVLGTMATKVHGKHAATYGYSCTTCHATVVDGTPAIIDPALHVNGANNVGLAGSAVYSAASGGSVLPAGGTCTATYCHSQGLDRSAPYTGTAPAYGGALLADWDMSSGALACTGCHGNPPSYANNSAFNPGGTGLVKKNSHAAHASFTCDKCHSATTADGTTIGTPANHANGAFNLAAGSGVSFNLTAGTATFTDASYTPAGCTTISCHNNGGATWGATLACSDCHDTNGATLSENGGVLGGANDGTANEVDNAQWINTGHGLASGQYDLDALNDGLGNAAANIGCYTGAGGCHDSAAAHVPTTVADPYRLGATYQDDPSALCLASCHTTLATNHHNDDVVANGATAYNFETKCIDCHDPHGDSNMFMIHNRVAADGADADNPKAMSSSKGIPDTTKAVTFVADANGTDYADTASPWVFTGICEVCHTATRWYQGQSGGGTFPGPQTGHDYTTNCGSCHAHPSGFKGSGCDGCHGDEAGSAMPNSLAPNGAAYPNQDGSHDAHVTAIGTGNSSCDTCHPGNPPAGHPDGSTAPARLINHDADGNGTVDADSGSYKNLAGSAVDADGRYNETTGTCVNIDCHGGTETPNWATGYVDSAGPVFSPDNVISVTNPATDQDLQIDWNAASDDTPPVVYDLYRADGTVPDACATGTVIAADLGVTSYFDSGLVNNNTYSYCVRAKDGWSPANDTTSTTAQGSPSAPAVGAQRYYLTKAAGDVWTGQAENMPACGSTASNAFAAAGSAATSVPPARGLLGTLQACTSASTNNWISNNSPNTSFESFVGFYMPSTYGVATRVTGTAATNFGTRSSTSSTNHQVNVYFARVNAGSGAIIGTAGPVVFTNSTSTAAPKTPNLSTLNLDVNGDEKFAVLFHWRDSQTATSASTNDRIMVDNYNSTLLNYLEVTEVEIDSTPPAFPANDSSIVAADAGTGGAANVSWADAVETQSNPVRYSVFAVQSASAPTPATLFAGPPVQSNLLATATTVTGLAAGNPWWFGVRATDAANLTDANTTISSPGVTPSGGGGGMSCTSCHPTPPNTNAHLAHATADADFTDCDKCHGSATVSPTGTVAGRTTEYTTTGPNPPHNDGSPSVYINALYDSNGATSNYDSGTKVCSGITCHGAGTPDWDNPASVQCGSCHGTVARDGDDRDGYPPTPSGQYVEGKHANHVAMSLTKTGNYCSLCHDGSGSGTVNHGTGTVDVLLATGTGPGGVGRGTFTQGAKPPASTCSNLDTGSCHSGSTGWDSTVALACTACHSGITTHTDFSTTTGNTPACTDCHPGSATYPLKHDKNGSNNIVEIPNNAAVGINKPSGFIHLGGDRTSGTTEADICWNCHSTSGAPYGNNISEWGTNTNTNGGVATYDFGSLSTPDWTAATWTPSAANATNFSYKVGAIQSIHTANSAGVATVTETLTSGDGYGYTETADNKSLIRCSYCHDVHETTGPTGKPYIRGTWMGNPYPEDGAPWNKTYVPTAGVGARFGPIPRGGSLAREYGGYFIDENNTNTNGAQLNATTWSYANNAGLCQLCHTNSVDTMDHTPSENLWVGTNGHSAAVIGGTGASAVNIFDYTHGRPTPVSTGNRQYGTQVPNMAQQDSAAGGEAYSYRFSSGGSYLPAITGATAMASYNWGATVDAGTTDPSYHQFPCSKCHNPHASRLPKLMITNCLDINHNTWDDAKSSQQTKYTAATNTDRNKYAAYYDSAQNCHRADDGQKAKNPGWNKVTPWGGSW